MNQIGLTVILTLLSFFAMSQDLIILKNRKKIQAKIVQIDSVSIHYYPTDFLDGPIRVFQKYEILLIKYENDKTEWFDVLSPEEQKKKDNKLQKPYMDALFRNGFFVDGIIGTAITTGSVKNYNNQNGTSNSASINSVVLTLGGKLGNKWYINKKEKWQSGIQVIWIRTGIYVGNDFADDIIFGNKSISLLNVGMTNIFKLAENKGIEANINLGPNTQFEIEGGDPRVGLSPSVELKYRYKQFAMGLEYQITFFDNRNPPTFYSKMIRLQTFGLSIGRKF